MLTLRGLGATNHFKTGGHSRSRAGIVYPDTQYHFLPLAISYDGKTVASGHGYQGHVGTKWSKSRGWVRLSARAVGRAFSSTLRPIPMIGWSFARKARLPPIVERN